MSALEHISIDDRHETLRAPRAAVARLVLGGLRRWQRSRAVNLLSGLDDLLLEDMGISRGDIPRVVDGILHEPEAQPASQAVSTPGPRISATVRKLSPTA